MCNDSPLEEGWNLEDSKYVIDWFDGEAAPQLLDVVRAEDQNIDDSDEIAQDEDDDVKTFYTQSYFAQNISHKAYGPIADGLTIHFTPFIWSVLLFL